MFESPLRYPGGKGRLTQYVIDLIEMNGLTGGHYVEPFAGGAGVALSSLILNMCNTFTSMISTVLFMLFGIQFFMNLRRYVN